MLIPVTLPGQSQSCSLDPKLHPAIAKISHDEYVLIELQGVLDIEGGDPKERNGKLVGTFRLDEATNKSTLLIGHHLLEGKIQALAKPLAILVRNPNKNTSKEEGHDDDEEAEEEKNAMDIDDDMQGNERVGGANPASTAVSGALEPSSTGWTITAIVKKKIIFSKRPMPVMGKK